MRWLFLMIVAAVTGLSGGAAAQQISNGRYYAVRGYNRSPFPFCKTHYDLFADVTDGIITFDSEDRIWTGDIDQSTGQIHIWGNGVSPSLKQTVFIQGPWSRARMFSSACGEGYFSLLSRAPEKGGTRTGVR